MTTDKNNVAPDLQPAELAEQQGEDAVGDQLLDELRDVEDYFNDVEPNPIHLATVQAAISALAARQPGAQVPTAWLIEWKNGVTALTKDASEAEAHRECKNCTVVPVYAAPPAQGIDLGQFRRWLCSTPDGAAADWTTMEDSRARFERLGRTIEPVFTAGPDVQGTRQDHLLDRRNRLMNSYGNGDREDAAVDAQIAQVDAELALIGQRDAAPGVRNG